MSNFIVYCATAQNGKKYIGITHRGLEFRKNQHEVLSRKGQTKLYRAIRKYGVSTFQWEVLLTGLTELEAKDKERELISKFDSFKSGYNMTLGGDGTIGYRHTGEFKKEQAERVRNRPDFEKRSREFVEKARNTPWTPERRESHRKRCSESNPNRKQVIDITTGIIFDCIRDVATHLDMGYSTLAAKLNGWHKNDTNFRIIEGYNG